MQIELHRICSDNAVSCIGLEEQPHTVSAEHFDLDNCCGSPRVLQLVDHFLRISRAILLRQQLVGPSPSMRW